MSIVIHGMKMPRFGDCIVITSNGMAYKYMAGDVAIYGEAIRPEEAEAIELPPHGRLIDADDIENITVIMNENGSGFNRIAAPTIIPPEEE